MTKKAGQRDQGSRRSVSAGVNRDQKRIDTVCRASVIPSDESQAYLCISTCWFLFRRLPVGQALFIIQRHYYLLTTAGSIGPMDRSGPEMVETGRHQGDDPCWSYSRMD